MCKILKNKIVLLSTLHLERDNFTEVVTLLCGFAAILHAPTHTPLQLNEAASEIFIFP